MKQILGSVLAGFALVISATVQAEESSHGFYVWADVVEVEPLVTTRFEEVPVRYCEENRRKRSVHHRRDHHQGSDTFPVLLGGVIGGVIGRQFGSGDGKRAMTVLGALAGAGIASSSRQDSKEHRHRSRRHVCETRYEREAYEVIDGYEVTYSYLGHMFQQTTDRHPGDQMRIFVTVDPVPGSTI